MDWQTGKCTLWASKLIFYKPQCSCLSVQIWHQRGYKVVYYCSQNCLLHRERDHNLIWSKDVIFKFAITERTHKLFEFIRYVEICEILTKVINLCKSKADILDHRRYSKVSLLHVSANVTKANSWEDINWKSVRHSSILWEGSFWCE